MDELVSYMQKLMDSDSSTCDSESAHSATSDSDSSKESKQHCRNKRAARKKKEKDKAAKSKSRNQPINADWKYCKCYERRTPHTKYPQKKMLPQQEIQRLPPPLCMRNLCGHPIQGADNIFPIHGRTRILRHNGIGE